MAGRLGPCAEKVHDIPLPICYEGGGYIPLEAGSAHALRRCMIFLGPSSMKGGDYIPLEAGSAHAFGRHMIFLGPSAMKGGGCIPWQAARPMH